MPQLQSQGPKRAALLQTESNFCRFELNLTAHLDHHNTMTTASASGIDRSSMLPHLAQLFQEFQIGRLNPWAYLCWQHLRAIHSQRMTCPRRPTQTKLHIGLKPRQRTLLKVQLLNYVSVSFILIRTWLVALTGFVLGLGDDLVKALEAKLSNKDVRKTFGWRLQQHFGTNPGGSATALINFVQAAIGADNQRRSEKYVTQIPSIVAGSHFFPKRNLEEYALRREPAIAKNSRIRPKRKQRL